MSQKRPKEKKREKPGTSGQLQFSVVIQLSAGLCSGSLTLTQELHQLSRWIKKPCPQWKPEPCGAELVDVIRERRPRVTAQPGLCPTLNLMYDVLRSFWSVLHTNTDGSPAWLQLTAAWVLASCPAVHAYSASACVFLLLTCLKMFKFEVRRFELIHTTSKASWRVKTCF